MKRTFSLLLAVILAVLLVCPAAAGAPLPWVQLNGQSVSLQGLPEQYHAVQVTLKLNQEPEPGAFRFDPSLSNGKTHTKYTVNGDSLTLYISSGDILNQGGSLSLGSLLSQGLTVESASDLELTTVGSNPSQTKTDRRPAVDINRSLTPNSGSQGSGGYYPSSGGSGGAVRYPINVPFVTGGTVQLSAAQATQGETITITATPGSGYLLRSLSVTDSTGRGVAAAGLGGGKWSFTMPASAVTVAVSFAPAQSSSLPFLDVGPNDWYREAVAYVYGAGLMNGTDETLFSPGDTTTRGMIVTILHRYEGSPSAGASAFRDVAAGAYYAASVSWAAANGVVNGIEPGLFGPDLAITREQMAAILHRYARSKGLDVSGRADLSVYADAGQVSAYAADAMAWAVRAGLITGVNSYTLQPGGFANRAQVATILMRFCQYAENR